MLIILLVSCIRENNPTDTTGFYLSDNGVTVHCNDSLVGEKADLNGVIYTKRDRSGLNQIILDEDWHSLTSSCTSGITDMSLLFKGLSYFDENIGSWDMSTVQTTRAMFSSAHSFNQDIGFWDVSRVSDMTTMFGLAIAFNQDISYVKKSFDDLLYF